MRLVKLSLEDWRGVAACEVVFSDGITLIEGPNEIGKSTIIEALYTLFSELDSSKKQSVKAIQPVGQDIGSSVEVEVITGDFHFVYSKTYNKKAQTELKILAPKVEQLTGREAHERAEQILEGTVDMVLWNALLVEQGKEVAGVSLAHSQGLVRALDEVVGSASPEREDSDLYSSVQAEYEKYYTLKAGSSRFAGLATEVDAARNVLDEARDALQTVESDSDDHARCRAEHQRLEGELPGLQEIVREHEASWKAITSLQQDVDAKQSECDTAQQFLKTALEDQERRKQLVADLVDGTKTLLTKRAQVEPLAKQASNLKTKSEKANKGLKKARTGLTRARAAAELARSDQQHLQATTDLVVEQKRLERLQGFNDGAAAARATLAPMKIDEAGLERLREAEREWQLAAAVRATATSAIEITAEQELTLALNDEQLDLATGGVERRDISAELRIAIPGVASITVSPSQSSADLEAEAADCKETLDGLLVKYSVKDLADAVTTEAKRADAARDLKVWVERINELLGDEVEADVAENVARGQARCDAYLADRANAPAMPADTGSARESVEAADKTAQVAEQEVESQQGEYDRLKQDYSTADADQRVATQEVDGLEAAQQSKQQQLASARAERADAVVDAQVTEKEAIVKGAHEKLQELTTELEAASPESAEMLLTNARDVRDRAEQDLREQIDRLLILEDRLNQAQANGRFESLDMAERELEELEARYKATESRAAAAALLWETLNKYRDETRKTYVRPLKDGIERLGRIVFGEDFSVELGEDWTLVSRTLGGKTIDFDDLSVGAKEQLGILTRLAAARIVSSQGGVPLIIDDALGFSDPSRLETMGAAIASAGKECQIILLTCTPGRFMHVGSAEVVRF